MPSPPVSEAARPIPLASSSSPSSGAVRAYPSYSYPQSGVEWSDYGLSQSSHAVASPSVQSTATYGQYAPMSGRSSPHTSVSSEELGQEPQVHLPSNDSITTAGGSQTINAPYPITTDMSGASLVQPTTTAYGSPAGLSIPVNGYSSDLSMATGSTPATSVGSGLGPGMMTTTASTVSDGFDGLSPCAYPILGGETYNRPPFTMADDFAAWLFNDGRGPSSSPTPSTLGYSQPAGGMMPGYLDSAQAPNPFFLSEPSFNGVFNHVLTQHPMSVTSLLERPSTTSFPPASSSPPPPPPPPQAPLSPKKRQDLLRLMSMRFNEAAYSAVVKRKDSLLTGDLDDSQHVLSLHMMQTYLASYWYHFHPQLPILHKPTFVADQTPSLLLLAVLAIGASTVDRGLHGPEVIEGAAELANFIAWHLRWELFMDVDFRPPAKLWIFQALVLLEVHEKRYSTRALHERAHIHHDTTLTLMRRGSSLIGREFQSDRPGGHHSRTGSTSDPADGSSSSWSNWIQAEGTRRVAFAALVLDSTHATMFGHSVKMVAHELRLPLPCDEALWVAPSAADVARVETTLHAHGIKPIMFLDGLKKTLNGEAVRTNAFGRAVLMSGLLSVSWHMNQRDLQASSLGVPQALGGRDKWRTSLLRAFDNWRRDYDEPYPPCAREDGRVLDTRDMLHGLAHIASHVDIVDCQIFAGTGRLMGRSITAQDYRLAREKMVAWVGKASARDATFYALKVLSKTLLDRSPPSIWNRDVTAGYYSARDDYLLNRPWVLYMAALVVWCYGYALDGPLSSPQSRPMSKVDQIHDMQTFLQRVGGVCEPQELEMISGRNQCLGLLMFLRDSFMAQTRWELLEEAAGLLGSCIGKL